MKRVENARPWAGHRVPYLTMIFLALLMLNGCSIIQTPIPMVGPRTEIATLEGEWYGENMYETLNEPDPEVLAIEFVQIWQGRVRGQLSPYRDPASAYTLYTCP